MNDEIVEEVHQIRERLYEEMKSLTPEERIAKTRTTSQDVRRRIAQIRASKAAEFSSSRLETIGQ